MSKWKGRWTARVEQDVEIDDDVDEATARQWVREEASPRHVVELLDIEIELEPVE